MSFHAVQASCQCGANTATITQQPIIRFYCHCLVCQKFTGKPYSDVCIFLRKDFDSLQDQNTEYKKYKLPPNIRRGKCKKCQQPSIELALGGKMVIIPSANIKDPQVLPTPAMHLFYHRRVEDIQDDLPKYTGFAKSQTMMLLGMSKGIYHNFLA